MADTNETIADIIADMRGLVKPSDTLNHTYELLNGLADRLEAAWKREKAAIEADALAVGGLVEASRSTAENSSAVGAAAKLREALEYVLHFDATDEAAMEDGLTDAERIAEYADHIKECQKKANAALAAPPRNCDVGTADEQEKRFIHYCKVCNRKDCACGYEELFRHKCAIKWAQMPYEEGGTK